MLACNPPGSDFNHTHLLHEVNFNNNICCKHINLAPLTSEHSSKYSFIIGSNHTSLYLPHSRTELDSHADTCTVGENALITHIHNRRVNVHAYDPSLGSQQDMSIVNAAVAYDCPHTGEVLIFKINQAIQIESMSHNLLCIMQLRMNDVKVFDCPKFLTDNPVAHTHSIFIPPIEGDDLPIAVPLSLHGVTSYFDTRKPTLYEYELAEKEGRSYDLTYDSPDWDPHSSSYYDQEVAADERMDAEDRGLMSLTAQSILEGTFGERGHSAPSNFNTSMAFNAHTVYERHTQCASVLSEISPTLCDDSFLSLLQSNVQVAFSSTKGNDESLINQLVNNWGIGLEAAKRTINATTQRVVRTVAHPSLSRRFRTNDR